MYERIRKNIEITMQETLVFQKVRKMNHKCFLKNIFRMVFSKNDIVQYELIWESYNSKMKHPWNMILYYDTNIVILGISYQYYSKWLCDKSTRLGYL